MGCRCSFLKELGAKIERVKEAENKLVIYKNFVNNMNTKISLLTQEISGTISDEHALSVNENFQKIPGMYENVIGNLESTIARKRKYLEDTFENAQDEDKAYHEQLAAEYRQKMIDLEEAKQRSIG